MNALEAAAMSERARPKKNTRKFDEVMAYIKDVASFGDRSIQYAVRSTETAALRITLSDLGYTTSVRPGSKMGLDTVDLMTISW